MVDNLTDKMHREWNLTNTDANNANHSLGVHHVSPRHSLSRKTSDHNGNTSSNHNNQHHPIHHQSPPMITTTDYSDPSSLSVMRVSQPFFGRRNLDAGYDTDGGIGTATPISKSHHQNTHGYEHFVSPRLPVRRSILLATKQSPTVSLPQHSPKYTRLAVNPPATVGQHHDDNGEESVYENNTLRRQIRLSRRIPHRSSSAKNQGTATTHAPTIPRHDGVLAATIFGRPFRLIFMRHSERANQALGPDWFIKAFRTNTYKSYDPNLPVLLPKRHFDQAYEFDAPITVHGLKNARHTGRAMLSSSLIADVCLSSIALRCVQTAERVLTGMDRTDHVPIRIEPGLFECPHLNHKIVDSFMTKKELMDNGYKIKHEYKPLIPKVDAPESLTEYFDRCVTVMRGILDRYGHHGGTVLIVTHAPGLLALTDAIKGKRPDQETFYRTVAAYPPLAIYIAEYDGAKWKHSDQPFSITPVTK